MNASIKTFETYLATRQHRNPEIISSWSKVRKPTTTWDSRELWVLLKIEADSVSLPSKCAAFIYPSTPSTHLRHSMNIYQTGELPIIHPLSSSCKVMQRNMIPNNVQVSSIMATGNGSRRCAAGEYFQTLYATFRRLCAAFALPIGAGPVRWPLLSRFYSKRTYAISDDL